MITVDKKYLGHYENKEMLEELAKEVRLAQSALEVKDCKGCEYTGWVDWPNTIEADLVTRIKSLAKDVRHKADCLVVVGIGGSYLGAKAVLSFLPQDFPVYFAGQNLSTQGQRELGQQLKDKTFVVNYVSKSGGTLEPAMAFRFLKEKLIEKHGKDWPDYVIATTDASKGKLRSMAIREGIESLVVPDDIGGRFSVLTPVGLFPLACAGVDIEALLAGAREERQDVLRGKSHAPTYAALRNLLYRQEKKVELLVTYDPGLEDLGAWWKQLFGESEGKDGQGIFPAAATFTTDLHSLGQFIQEGSPILMETVLWIDKVKDDYTIPKIGEDIDDDGLNHLDGKSLHWINEMACLGTMQAHLKGDTPSIKITLPAEDAHSLGALLYFFMYACGLSALVQGVNPFDQPGVEEYKVNVKARLAGHEKGDA